MIVPTKYYKTPTQVFKDLNISMIIWANHNLRASVNAMQNVTKKIYDNESLLNVEKTVSKKISIFPLQQKEN